MTSLRLYMQMNCLGDDLLSNIFQRLPWRDRARLASVCRHWRTLSSTHAAVVWRSVSIDEEAVEVHHIDSYGAMLRWCRACGFHIRDLRLMIERVPPMWLFGVPEDMYGDRDEDRGETHGRLLIELCAILFTAGSQLQRLSVSTYNGGLDGYAYLPRKLISMISLATALECLTVAIPEQRNFKLLADSIRSLQRLKVADVEDVGDPIEEWQEHPRESYGQDATAYPLICAACCCPLLEQMKLVHMFLRELPARLSAATRLTSLVLRVQLDSQLSVAANALPCSLRRLRLTEEADDFTDAGGVYFDDTDMVPGLPRHFGGLDSLQHLQLTAHSWGRQCLPTGLKSLRLEAPIEHTDRCDVDELLGGISALTFLEKLHMKGFQQLGSWPADVAAALQPLRRLRALGFDTCGLQESPATSVLSRLTLLSLRNNGITTLADALPTAAIRTLCVLDLSGNAFGRPPDARITHWTDTNMAAFSGNWESLQVLGMQPAVRCKVTGRIRITATTLNIQLRRQATAAQPPRRPPVVVYSQLHEELLRPADELAVVR